MSETLPAPTQLISEMKVSAHLMTLQTGVFCIYHLPGSAVPDPITGLPGARLTLPPGPDTQNVAIRSFRKDGWLGGPDEAALVRVASGPAQILMTVYMGQDSSAGTPKLQVMRLSGAEPAAEPAVIERETVVAAGGGIPLEEQEVAAHIQSRGDVVARLGEWIGEPGSQRWIEGFAVTPRGEVLPDGIEYQAVLGRGWLSPWAEGGQFCGSRGMALPILGLRVRLRGAALATHAIELVGSFTDGSSVGPVGAGDPCEAETLAPLEAFRIVLRKLDGDIAPGAAVKPQRGKDSPGKAPRGRSR